MTALSPAQGAFLAVFGAAWGVVCHELAHYAAARLLGRDAAFRWRAVETVWVIPDGRPDWRDFLIARWPLLSGLLLALRTIIWPELPVPLVVAVPWWLTYSFGGVVGELWGGDSDLNVRTEAVES